MYYQDYFVFENVISILNTNICLCALVAKFKDTLGLAQNDNINVKYKYLFSFSYKDDLMLNYIVGKMSYSMHKTLKAAPLLGKVL